MMATQQVTTHETIIGRLTIETRVYEDGYIHATLLDEFGSEIASLDGHERNGNTRGLIEDFLADQHGY